MSAQTALVLVGVFVAAVAVGRLSRRWRRRERTFTGAVRRDVFRRWGPRCAYRWIMRSRCGGSLHVDHQRAYSRGGTTSAANGQPLCERHNTSKGAAANWRYVLFHAWPVVGHFVYIVRHRRAEGDPVVTVDPMVKVAALRCRVRLTDGRVVTLIGWPPNRARAKVLDAAYRHERVDKTEIVEAVAS